MKQSRLLAILTAGVILTGCFIGCSGASGSEDGNDTTEETVAPAELTIAADGISDFYVIRGDTAGKNEVDAAVTIRKAVTENSGAEVGISTDWEKSPVYEHELIVGHTLREASGEIDRIALGETGYLIREKNGKIFIAGGSDKGLALAVEYFVSHFVKGKTNITIPVGYEKIAYHQYDIPDLYIDMHKVDKFYSIVLCNENDKKLKDAATKLQTAIYEKTGLYLSIVSGKADAQNAFVLSDETPEQNGVYTIHVNGSSLVFASSSNNGLAGCVNNFVRMYLNDRFGRYNFPKDFRYLEIGDYIIVTPPKSAQ